MTKVYIVLLNYKGHKDTVECLESLLKLEYHNFQIIVVDNSPTDESVHYLQQWSMGGVSISTSFPSLVYPLCPKPISVAFASEEELADVSFNDKILIIKAKENKGYAAGNNVALRYIFQNGNFEYVWLLNNDTVVESSALIELVKYYAKTSEGEGVKLGLLGATLLYYNNPDLVQGVGGLYNKGIAAASHQADGKALNEIGDRHFPIDYVIGASMFMTKEFLDKTGFMAEDYFLYFEEIDWAVRARKLNYSVDYCPTSFVYHKEGSTINNSISYTRKKSELADFYGLRNRILFTKKHYPQYLPIVYLSFFMVIFNRIKRTEFRRLHMILNILINPTRHHQG